MTDTKAGPGKLDGSSDLEAGRDPRWDLLAAPFPQNDVERKPQVIDKQSPKGRCETAGRGACADDHPCGGYHQRAIHVDYIGHAGITMRINDVVGPENWTWEPVSVSAEGLPLMARGEFWIKLTILGVTKLGVGDNFPSSKEAIGDALRNAAMRFGIGTYLWAKSERAAELKRYQVAPEDVEAERPGDRDAGDVPDQRPPVAPVDAGQWVGTLRAQLQQLSPENQAAIRGWWPKDFPKLEALNEAQARVVANEATRLADPWGAGNPNPGDDPWATQEPQDPQNARQ